MVLETDRFWVIDVEGNGASPPEIIEIAMVEVKELKLTGVSHRWLVKPVQPINPIASRIHGLTDQDVATAPSFAEISKSVIGLLADAPIVGHNVRVEVDAIARSIPGWVPKVAVDTLRLARDLRPKLESYSLEKLGESLCQTAEAARLSSGRHHSALFDATLAALVFVELLLAVSGSRRSNALLDADIFDQRQGSLI